MYISLQTGYAVATKSSGDSSLTAILPENT
jgi:hypothetical protein